MDYNEALNYIRGKNWKSGAPGLDRTRELLERLGNPEQGLRILHIAGTNGKGSVAAMCSSILRKAGYKTGLYTSPSIQRYNERVQIDGEMIPDNVFAALMGEEIIPQVEQMNDPATEFEMLTCLALLWFKRQGCEAVVLETGMGGEYDSTNAIPCPEVAVITAIGMDHMEQLGGTIEEIARTKAGIIKHGCDVVLNGNDPRANEVIERVCEQRRANLTIPDYSTLTKSEASLKGQYFSYKHYNDLFIPLLGDYQPQNAAVAIETMLALKRRGWKLNEQNVRDGLRAVVWPGRFELLSEQPVFIVDGAHNPQGVAATVAGIQRYFPQQQPVILVGVMADKDVDGMLEKLQGASDCFVCVTPDNPRALPAAELAAKLQALEMPAQACETVSDGISRACEIALSEQRPVIALGSLYLVGAARTRFKG